MSGQTLPTNDSVDSARPQSELIAALAQACGHTTLGDFTPDDHTTLDRQVAELTGIRFGSVG